MDDLISRKALLAEYDRVHIGEPGKARKLIEDAPRADAVEVVRCKDCIELDRTERFDHLLSGTVRFYCPYSNGYVPLNHFCAYGERRTDNERKAD